MYQRGTGVGLAVRAERGQIRVALWGDELPELIGMEGCVGY